MRTALHTAGMLIFGLGMLAAFAALVHWRSTLPVVEAPGAAAGASAAPAPRSPRQALADGLATTLAIAHESLASDPSRAAHTLDAARRIAETGGFAALESIRQARHALQNGSPQAAREALAGSARLRAASSAPPPSGPLQRYQGAVLINRYGARIGEVTGARGQELLVRLEGGEARAVPATELVFGPVKGLGTTRVAWPA